MVHNINHKVLSQIILSHPLISTMEKKILLLGGCGFVGKNLARDIVNKGWSCCIFDFCDKPDTPEIADFSYIQGDITKPQSLNDAMSSFKPTCVIHLASYGMSGSAMLNAPRCFAVNVLGVENTLDACLNHNVPHLIYTSTYNVSIVVYFVFNCNIVLLQVVFGGQEIVNASETDTQYFPIDQHTDAYGPTKAQAEQLVVQANGRRTKVRVTLYLTHHAGQFPVM